MTLKSPLRNRGGFFFTTARVTAAIERNVTIARKRMTTHSLEKAEEIFLIPGITLLKLATAFELQLI